MIKIVAKKKKSSRFNVYKGKNSLAKNEHRVRFGNNHNPEMLIIQKSVLLIN